MQGFGGEIRRKQTTWKTQASDGRIILKWILGRLDGRGIVYIDLAQDMDRWRALVHTVMNFRFR